MSAVSVALFLRPEPAVPMVFAVGHHVFNPPGSALKVVEARFQSAQGRLSVRHIGIIELPLPIVSCRAQGLRLHEDRGHDVDDQDGNEAGHDPGQDHEEPDPEDMNPGKVRDALADTEDPSGAGAVEGAGCVGAGHVGWWKGIRDVRAVCALS